MIRKANVKSLTDNSKIVRMPDVVLLGISRLTELSPGGMRLCIS